MLVLLYKQWKCITLTTPALSAGMPVLPNIIPYHTIKTTKECRRLLSLQHCYSSSLLNSQKNLMTPYIHCIPFIVTVLYRIKEIIFVWWKHVITSTLMEWPREYKAQKQTHLFFVCAHTHTHTSRKMRVRPPSPWFIVNRKIIQKRKAGQRGDNQNFFSNDKLIIILEENTTTFFFSLFYEWMKKWVIILSSHAANCRRLQAHFPLMT